jgi:hypothetical protein
VRGGADTVIGNGGRLHPERRVFLAVFSTSYFPDAQIVLEWAGEEGGVFREGTGETDQVKTLG